MRTPPFYLLLSVFILFGQVLSGQIYREPFDVDLNGWTPQGAWQWDENGEADGITGVDWNNRSRIQSASLGGAALFANVEPDGQLISPIINIPAGTTSAYLSFYSYFRSNGGAARVSVLSPTNAVILDTTLQLGLQAGEETSAGYFSIIDLGAVPASGITRFRIQFDVEGPVDFWLLDDIVIDADRPAHPTFPRYFGNSLSEFGIPFIVDSTGAPAVPFQLVADFLPNISEADRAAFRQLFNAVAIRSCVCDRIELWELPGGLFFDPISGEPLGDPSAILQNTLPGQGMNKVDGLDLNYYSYNDLLNLPAGPNAPLTDADVAGLDAPPAGLVKVAILDTGIDIDHPDFNGYLFADMDDLGNNNDDDTDCYPDNPLGWNFVDDNNNPNDDNGHGTHVSGIVVDQLRPCPDCPVQLLPYKTHDSHGVGTLFASTCAVLQASVNDGADVINASWGFYGGNSTILRSAIDTAANYGALFVAAAGNDSLNLLSDPQYPASYPLANILSVGAVDTLPVGSNPVAAFSNYNAALVDLAAFGVAVESSLPGGGRGIKSGTSMSAPAVSAAAARYICDGGDNFGDVRTAILDEAWKKAELAGFFLDGNVLNTDLFCKENPFQESSGDGAVYGVSANPDFTDIKVLPMQDQPAVTIHVYNAAGSLLVVKKVNSMQRGQVVTVPIGQVPAGNYLVSIDAGGRLWVQRLVKR